MHGETVKFVATSLRAWRSGVRTRAGLRDFSFLRNFRPVLGPTQPTFLWIPRGKAAGVWSSAHFHLALRLRMCGALPLSPWYACMVWTGTAWSYLSRCLLCRLYSVVIWSEFYAEGFGETSVVVRFKWYMIFFHKVFFARTARFEILVEWGVANCILFYDRQLYFRGTSKVTPHTLRTCQCSWRGVDKSRMTVCRSD
jgi:hypothetical protein